MAARSIFGSLSLLRGISSAVKPILTVTHCEAIHFFLGMWEIERNSHFGYFVAGFSSITARFSLRIDRIFVENQNRNFIEGAESTDFIEMRHKALFSEIYVLRRCAVNEV